MSFDLGPYGDFIWVSYGVSLVALVGVTVWAALAYARAKARLKMLDPRAAQPRPETKA